MNVYFLPTLSVVFLLEYTFMLLLITSVKVRSTRTCMCEISSILLKFCAKFWQISSKMFVIPSSNLLSVWKEWQPCRLQACTLSESEIFRIYFSGNFITGVEQLHGNTYLWNTSHLTAFHAHILESCLRRGSQRNLWKFLQKKEILLVK